MGAVWTKNELVAAKRRADLIVYQDGGMSLADRGTDFIALGILFIGGSASPNFALAAGTCTNKRVPFTFSSFTFTADNTTEKLNKVAHGLETGDGPIRVSNSGGALPGGLAAATDYWVIYFDDDNIKLAATLADAYAGTAINITSNGTGTQTLAAGTSPACHRGLDGYFCYEATQGETNVDASEIGIIVEGSGYRRANGGGTYTTVGLNASTQGFEATGEGGHTYGDLIRLMVSILAGKVVNFTTGTQAFRDLADSKTRLTGTTDATGRLTITVGDLT